MITRIGVIYQDANSGEFLRGLKDRLQCEAEIVEPPTPIGKQQVLTLKEANKAWKYFQKKGVDLVVRFTDADQDRWQDVQRWEKERVPPGAESIWIIGIAVENVEQWLCLDQDYLKDKLQLAPGDLKDKNTRTGQVKRAIKIRRSRGGGESVVSGLVREAPPTVFKRWLKDKALNAFYSKCKDAAKDSDCEIPNELEK